MKGYITPLIIMMQEQKDGEEIAPATDGFWLERKGKGRRREERAFPLLKNSIERIVKNDVDKYCHVLPSPLQSEQLLTSFAMK